MIGKNKAIHIGLSPCPNDTFIFHALLHGLIDTDWGLDTLCEAHMADVEKLNGHACMGTYEFSKISLGVMPYILDKYMLLSSGAALGWGCGPLVVAREKLSPEQCRNATVAIPGKMTTANLLLDLHGGFSGPRQELLFSEIMPAVARGDVDAGVIIHEGRFTYGGWHLQCLLDLGQWWEDNFHMPLPLGAIAMRRDVSRARGLAMQKAIANSLRHAWQYPEHSRQFIQQNAQEMDEAITSAHIRTFVTEYSLDLGDGGKKAIELLLAKAMCDRERSSESALFL